MPGDQSIPATGLGSEDNFTMRNPTGVVCIRSFDETKVRDHEEVFRSFSRGSSSDFPWI